MSQSYPAFIGFHSIGNCFGYVKSNNSINNDSFNVKESVGSGFLGNFRMRSCENPNIYCDLQVFGRTPFTNVYVNSVFADVSGFHEKQEVILEKITTTTFCSYIDVAPKTDDDYSVIAQSQAGIEMNFLNQIRLVSNNMIIPYFVSPGVHVQLRILNIIPQTNNPVILNNETELHVQTVLESSDSKTKNQIAQNVSKIVQTLSSDGFISNYVIELESKSLSARILPRKIVDSWIKQQSQELDENTIYIAGEKNSLYTKHGIVEVRTNSSEDGIYEFYYLHRTSERKLDEKFNYALHHMFDSLKNSEKFCCIDGSGNLSPYTTIEIQAVDQNRLRYLHSVDVLIDKQTLEWIHKYQITAQLLKSISSKIKTNPIVLPLTGKSIEVSIEGKDFEVKLMAVTKNIKVYENVCFLMDLNCEIHLKEQQSESEEKKETGNFDNYGLNTFDDVVHIGSHSKHLSDIASSCSIEGNHSLLLGNSGSGKSYFIKRLARRLAHSTRINYCKLIQCSSFKGKSSDALEKTLTETFLELELRKPSVLFLDDFDSILPKIDQEQRQIPLEKVVSVFCQKLRKTKINVIIVAQRLSTLNDDFVESAIRARPIVPNRFELTSLTLVSLGGKFARKSF
ncbi:unnamed protein product [Caenorhabditis angaria]|uniref:Peroxisomal ATPase PEX1 n=1 Tax=Caenorhabditis angaria TaxID=860376 RepID=A0A9P1J5N1_9PELO|nr:unnamed protein product [Caenorhabditis angaria]